MKQRKRSPIRGKRSRVRTPAQECACANCGCPLYVGDALVEVRETPYCSVTCAHGLGLVDVKQSRGPVK